MKFCKPVSLAVEESFWLKWKWGIAKDSIDNWALFWEDTFCPDSSLQFLCQINNASGSSTGALGWGSDECVGLLLSFVLMQKQVLWPLCLWQQDLQGFSCHLCLLIPVKHHQKLVFLREQNMVLPAINGSAHLFRAHLSDGRFFVIISSAGTELSPGHLVTPNCIKARGEDSCHPQRNGKVTVAELILFTQPLCTWLNRFEKEVALLLPWLQREFYLPKTSGRWCYLQTLEWETNLTW